MPEKTLYTIIVPAAHVGLARSLAQALAGEAGAGMWVRGLCPTDATDETPTAYISSGDIDDAFGVLMSDPQAIYEQAQAAGVDVPLEQIEALVAGSVIARLGEPLAVMADAGLRFCAQPTEG